MREKKNKLEKEKKKRRWELQERKRRKITDERERKERKTKKRDKKRNSKKLSQTEEKEKREREKGARTERGRKMEKRKRQNCWSSFLGLELRNNFWSTILCCYSKFHNVIRFLNSAEIRVEVGWTIKLVLKYYFRCVYNWVFCKSETMSTSETWLYTILRCEI